MVQMHKLSQCINIILIDNYTCSSFNSSCLVDLYVVDETVLALTGDDECTLDLPEYGLHINFPKGSLSSGHTAELQMKAIVGQHFVLTPECYIMSVIYQLICPS